MKTVNRLTLQPGTMVAIPTFGQELIARIEQLEYDKFRVSLSETDPEIGFDVDTRGFNRVPEGIGEEVAMLPLTEFDLITTAELGTRSVWSIDEIRPGRYQFVLGKKYEPNIVVNIDGASADSY